MPSINPFALAAVASVLAIASAGAENFSAWKWSVSGDDTLPYLVFGNAAREESRFVLICDNERREASVTVAIADKQARRGQPVRIDLIGNGQSVTMSGRIATDNGVYGYAQNVPYKKLVTVLRQPGPVSLELNGKTYMLAERDRAKQLDTFADICKLK
jgi:hypothetical protein